MEKVLLTKGRPVLYQNRYCDQENFNVVISIFDKGKLPAYNVSKVEYPRFSNAEILVVNSKYDDIVLTSCSSIYIIRIQTTEHFKISPKKYSVSNNIVQMPDLRKDYCACSFMKCLYVFGGYLDRPLSTCFKYSLITGKWIRIASLKIERYFAACTVFEGKIVVSGGASNETRLSSVESYDHHENKWTNLPDMIKRVCNHGAVSMGNKMYVIGGNYELTCEVFDSVSRNFTTIMIEIPSTFDLKHRKRKRKRNIDDLKFGIYYKKFLDGIAQPVSIGNNVIVMAKCNSSVNKKYLIYDVLTGEWKLQESSRFGTYYIFSCSRVPFS